MCQPTSIGTLLHEARTTPRATIHAQPLKVPCTTKKFQECECFAFPRPTTLLIIFRYQGTQRLDEIALSPVGTSGTSSVSPQTALNNKPGGNSLPFLTLQFHCDGVDRYPFAGSLPLTATAASSSSRNEATRMVKYGMKV